MLVWRAAANHRWVDLNNKYVYFLLILGLEKSLWDCWC
jgi:hypothetical protein